MSLERLETRDLDSIQDFYPTENYNVIVGSDDHLFDITDPYKKAKRIEEETEIINQAAEAFNAPIYCNLGDSGGAVSMARLLEGLHNIDEAVILEGDEDDKKGDGSRNLGWATHPQGIGDLMDGGPEIRTGEEFIIYPSPKYDIEYEIMLDHYPRTPRKEDERNFQYDWFADDLFYEGTGNDYCEVLREPKVALTGHVHAPEVRTIDASIAVNVGSWSLNYNTTELIPERNFYAVSFGSEEVQTSMIDVKTEEIVEYNIFRLDDDGFKHEFSYSSTGAYHPEQRIRRDIIEDHYGNITDIAERLYPEKTSDTIAAD